MVAALLLLLKLMARRMPVRPALQAAPVDDMRMLAAYRRRRAEYWSGYEFWSEVAKLGGLLACKEDGDPGWQTLWRGWQRLAHVGMMTLGVNLFHGETVHCG